MKEKNQRTKKRKEKAKKMKIATVNTEESYDMDDVMIGIRQQMF